MKKAVKLFLLVFLLFLSGAVLAQPAVKDFQLLNQQVRQYEKAEWDIRIAEGFQNPFNQKEVALDLLLTSPSGKPLLLPCYFENEGVWKARFAPQESGKYTYVFRLRTKDASTESSPGSFVTQPGDKPGFLHKNDLWTFRFDNGQLFRGIGENVGWEARSFENDKYTYDYLLPTLARNGANFFRTWMCYWNLPLEWQKVSATNRYTNTGAYFNPGAIRRMDALVNLADSLGLYFMLSLDWHGHLMPNGGWKNSPYNQVNGGPAKEPADFFTMQSAMERYKNKLRYVVGRWGYSTSIAVWEFFNEVDNAAFTPQDSILIPLPTIAQWHLEMSRYLKDIDPYQHLVSTSISHRDILGMNSIPYIDFNQKHIYKHTEKIPAIYPDYIQTYGKPYVVGEFGYRWEDADPKYAREANYDYKRGLWYGLFSTTPILPMTWWWEFFDDQQMTPYFKGVRTISDQMLKAGQGSFIERKVTAGLLESYSVQCGDTYFVYLLNNTDAPVTTPVALETAAKGTYAVQAYAPAAQKYAAADNAVIRQKQLATPAVTVGAKTELVLILTPKPAGVKAK